MITISRSEYEELKREISRLRELVQQLIEENTLLKGGKNSRTSSTAPSHDIGRSNRISLRQPSDRKPGGQPGHSGVTLLMSDTPDQVINHSPHVCEHCGENLHQVESKSFTGRQEFDLPSISSICIEHRAHIKICPLCSFPNRGLFPDRLQAPVQYGAQVEATAYFVRSTSMTGYLSVYQGLPYKRISQLFKDFFGLNLSEGVVDTFLDRLSKKSEPVYDDIGDRIRQSEVVGSDETGCRVNGKKHWFHVWQTRFLTFIVSSVSRGHKVIEEYFPDGFTSYFVQSTSIHSFYVSDCWSSQLKVVARAHQLCMAHLLRELTNFVENLKSQWSAKMKELFLSAIELKKKMTENDYLNTPLEVVALNEKLDELLAVDFSKFHKKEQAFIKRLNKHRQSILYYVRSTQYLLF